MIRFLSVTLLALVHGSAFEVTPVQKVVALLQGMLEKGKKEKYQEQEAYAKFNEFCKGVITEKDLAISDEMANIEHFTADIRKERATAQVMKHDIRRMDKAIAVLKGDIQAATNVRAVEKADYDALYQDYSESVDALMNAIETLKKQAPHTKSAKSAMVQISAVADLNLIPKSAKKALDMFVQQGEEAAINLALGAPEANAYEFHSAKIVEMLRGLLDKFIDERRTIDKQEANSQEAYEQLVESLKYQIETLTERRGGKAVGMTKELELKAENKEERIEEINLKAEDTEYRKDFKATCIVKTKAFRARQHLRANEITALEKAITIIKSGAISGNADKHLPALLQKSKKGSALYALRSSSSNWNRVATYLQEQAAKLNSRILAVIAVHAAKDPFIKVKKMLKDLLVHLLEQANEEAQHKGWCDTEIAGSAHTRAQKTRAVEVLQAEIDEIKASIAKLSENIRGVTVELADIDEAIATQTRLRMEEKAKNAETIKDSKEAQVAVDQALTVLRDFYDDDGSDGGDDFAFVQKNSSSSPKNSSSYPKNSSSYVQPKNSSSYVQKNSVPDTPDSAYTKMADESIGVLGMLEVIQGDFARLESSTRAAEASAQEEYDKFMADSKRDKAVKKADIEHKTNQKQDKEGALAVKHVDMEGTEQELNAAFAYFDKLKPSCVDAGVDYDDRVLRRNEEIESLRGALRILSGEEIP